MFEVRCDMSIAAYPEVERILHKAAGRISDFSGCGICSARHELGWRVPTFRLASEMKQRLDKHLELPANVTML